MKKSIGILLYLALMAVFLKFDLRLLFDLRQFLLVLFGTVLLLLPSLNEREGEEAEGQEGRRRVVSKMKCFLTEERTRIGQNAVWAGLLQTLVLLFLNMSVTEPEISGMQTVAVSCRPILYGFCIWIILQDSGKAGADAGSEKVLAGAGTKYRPMQKALQADVDYRSCLQDLGLTKREVEIALLVIQSQTNAEIAEQLFISETTVKKHMSNIFTKLGIGQRQEIREKCISLHDSNAGNGPRQEN